MSVLVDTNIWSEGIRRAGSESVRQELESLIRDSRAQVIGPIRQEVLSGIKSPEQFAIVRDRMRAFPDLPLTQSDFEMAAQFFNQCRQQGIQGSHTDFLICAVADRHKMAVFTLDQDFLRYQPIIGLTLHQPDFH